MKRREFITLFGGAAAAWPLAARAQQPAMPVIGFLNATSPDTNADNLRALREGLKDTGYVEGRNLAIEYRFAEGHYDRLPSLAADLVRLKVAVILASGGGVAQLAAKAATTTIPIVFVGGVDPVQFGLVSSLNRPGGNITGVSFASNISESKRLGLLHAMIPAVTTIGVLMNPDNASVETQTRALIAAAHTLGLKLEIANARGEGDFERAFASLVERGARGLDVASDVFLNNRIEPLAMLAARYGLPAIYAPLSDARATAAAGGLMSYGASIPAAYHQAGIYIGRILHGEKPGDLPVMLPTNFQLAINLKTAKALGIEVPPTLSAIADEIIE
jgi:putative tryptophan/tyrosine transport system substrate-binding protein